MDSFYNGSQRALQEQFETGKTADLLEQVIVHPEVHDDERALIESRDMFFLATVDAVSRIFVNCSRYVPRPQCETPVAEWKRIDVVQEVLPPRDAGKTAKAGGTITVDEYEAKLAAGEA